MTKKKKNDKIFGAPYVKKNGALGSIYSGDLIRSVTTGKTYKVDVYGRKIVLKHMDGSDKLSDMSIARFVHYLNEGQYVTANGLDRAVDRSKQKR